MRKFFILSAFVLGFFVSYGQNKGEIKGYIIDSVSSEVLSLATITLFNASDTSVINYKLSDFKGEFRLTGLPLNLKSRLLISYSGYAPLRRDVILTEEEPVLDLGRVVLFPDSEALEEVIFTLERPPILVKNDTIEFNANSFKTLPTALVEDLLKKLPGVDVDGQGNISVNGKRVNKILVDGKTFFGDDPKMASRNLPANLIDKIQVMDDKEELDRLADNNVDNVGKVINLTFKKDVKKGWFGKIYAGVGTRDGYEAGAIANIFRDTMQLSIMGGSNNVNRSWFSMGDIQSLGGFNRSGMQSISVYRGSSGDNFSINGINFGGNTSGGVTRSSGAGFNLNHAPNSKQSLFLQYFFGQNKNVLEDGSYNRQFIKDSIIDINRFNDAVSRANQHNIGAGFKYKPNEYTNLDLNVSATISDRIDNRNVITETITNKQGEISKGEGLSLNDNNSFSYFHNLYLTKRSKNKKGRIFNLSQNMNHSKSRIDFITDQDNYYYYPFTDTVSFNQLRNARMPSTSVNLQANLTEPLSEAFSIRLIQRFGYSKNEEDINTYGMHSGVYDQKIDALSNYLRRDHFTSSSRAALNYKYKKLVLSAGIVGLYQDVQDEYFKTAPAINRSEFNIMKEFSLSFNGIYLNYYEGFNMPSLQNLNPVVNISDPFRITMGNPDLEPIKSKSVSLNYFKFDMKSSMNYMFYANMNFEDNGVITSRLISDDGVQTFKPVNAGGNNSGYLSAGLKKDFKKSTGFIFSVSPSLNYQFSDRKLLVNNIESNVKGLTAGPSVRLGLDWKSKVEFRPAYSYTYSSTKYSDPSFNNLKVNTNRFEGELILRPGKNFVFETNLTYFKNSSLEGTNPRDFGLWNAAVTYLFLKDQKGHLKLSVLDILNENNNYSRRVSENYINEYNSNVLQRYFLLTFTYNIRTMGQNQKVGGTQRFMFF